MRVHVGPSCGGGVSTLRVGVRHRPASAEGLRRALIPTRVKGMVSSHAPQHTHTESALCARPRSCVVHAHHATTHVASLAHTPRRYVNE